MKSVDSANIVASGVALVALAVLEALSAACFLPVDEHFWPLVAVGYVVLVVVAVWTWSDSASRTGGKAAPGPTSWREWVGAFFASLALSVVFIALDKTVQHSGLSLTFTMAAVATTMISLPNALRAALLEAFARRNVDRP